MALVSSLGPVYFPAIDHTAPNAGTPGQETAILLDAAAEKGAYIFKWPKTGIAHKVRFRTGTVTTGDTLKVSFQDVDLATGDPDGVVDQFRTIVVANGDDNASLITGILTDDGTDTGVPRSVTRGELGCVVFEFDSFVAGALNLATRNAQQPAAQSHAQYTDHFTAAWAKSTAAQAIFAIEYSDGSYAPIPYMSPSVAGIAAETYNTGSTPDERGLIFQVPFPCKVVGAWGFLDVDGDADIVLYDSDGTTVLESVSLDTNVRLSANPGVYHELWDTEITLAKATNYRLAFKPTTVTNATLYVGSYTAAAVLDALTGGQACHYTARTDAGAWAQTTDKRPLMGVILSALDDGVSSGGGSGLPVINRSRLRRMA